MDKIKDSNELQEDVKRLQERGLIVLDPTFTLLNPVMVWGIYSYYVFIVARECSDFMHLVKKEKVFPRVDASLGILAYILKQMAQRA